jgi:pyruvate/2-oxoglutarate dehydrogenase complex dihydrolipoamide acyltransferase (E2) component
MANLIRATENVYAPDTDGIRRLVAAAGDDYDPNKIPVVGIITRHDPPAAALLPLDGYDELGEQQVLELLRNLDIEQLLAVHAYERAHLARGSITGYSQPTHIVDTDALADASDPGAPDTAPTDYAAMSVEDLQARVDGLELEVTGTGANGNVVKADLVAALRAHDAAE